MDKLKGMMKISQRDKNLLIIVGAILIVVLAYFFGYSKLSIKVDELSSKKSSLEVTYRDLKEKNNNKDKYISDTNKLNKNYANAIDKYDSGNSQPNTIEFFRKTEAVTGAWVRSLSLSQPTVLYKFGQISTSNVNNTSEYSSNLVGYKSTITISYDTDYNQWKDFIKYINTYSNKSTIDSISAAYNDATGQVTGTAAISLYSIQGSERKFTEPSFDVKTGTDNISSLII